MFEFDYIPEEQLASICLLEQGDATFTIRSFEEGLSKDGSPMLKLVLICTDMNGKHGIVYENITTKMQWKISSLTKSAGKHGLYKSGKFDPRLLLDFKGRCRVKTKINMPYPDQTVIAEYLPAENQETAPNYIGKIQTQPQTFKDSEDDDSDIPF